MNYLSFYDRHVSGLKESGKWLTGWCPFHEDQGSEHRGFCVNRSSGLWKCYSACSGSGGDRWQNDITFCKLRGVPIEEAPSYDPNYRKHGYSGGAVHRKPSKSAKREGAHDTWEGPKEARNKNPYNVEAIDLARSEGKTLWICEGAKDAETMLAEGELAVGIPGATNWKVMAGQSLDDIPEVIIVGDNDDPGKKMSEKLKDMFPHAKVVDWLKSLPQGYDVTNLWEETKKIELNFVDELKRQARRDFWLDEGEQADWFLTEIKQGSPRISTGFKEFDEKLRGLMPGGLHVIQGGSSVGKTTFCKQLADQVHMKNPELPVFFFALEDSVRTMRAMTLARTMHIPNHHIIEGKESLSETEYNELKQGTDEAKSTIYGRDYYLIAGEPNINVSEIRDRIQTKLRRIQKTSALVIVDYLQILPTPREEKLSSLMDRIDFNLHELQCLARDIDGPVILTSSTTKEALKETEKGGKASQIKGKGSANILYTPRMLFELLEDGERRVADGKGECRPIKLVVLKNSEGPKDIELEFEYFVELSMFREKVEFKI